MHGHQFLLLVDANPSSCFANQSILIFLSRPGLSVGASSDSIDWPCYDTKVKRVAEPNRGETGKFPNSKLNQSDNYQSFPPQKLKKYLIKTRFS